MEFACLFGDNCILVSILGKNVIIIISNIIGRDLNDCMSRGVGNDVIVIFHGRWMIIDRRWRHDFFFKRR